MKKYFYSVLAAGMLFATSCSHDNDLVNEIGGESRMVTLKVRVPNQTESRTVGGAEIGDGSKANNLIWAMYEANTIDTLITGKTVETSDGLFSISVPMAKDLRYDLLFLAYNADNCPFVLDPTSPNKTDLRALQFKTTQKANNDAMDAFVGVHNVGIDNQAVTELDLHRPFAQINAATSLQDMKFAETLKTEVTEAMMTIKKVPGVYNVHSQEATGEIDVIYQSGAVLLCDQATEYPKNEKISVDNTDYYYLSLAYVLAGANKDSKESIHTADFEFYRLNGDKVSSLHIESLPIQRNYRTNIVGNLLTKVEDYQIKIDAEFDGAHKVGIWDGTTDEDGVQPDTDNTLKIYNGSELAWIASEVDGGNTFAGKTIKLMNDIDLANIAWNPIGTTGDAQGFYGVFDGNGKTISNLYVDLTKTPGQQSAGLFASANYATIKDFTIKNAVVKNMTTLATSGSAVVLGSSQYGVTISNVNVQNAVVESNRLAAGIVGYFKGTVENCSVDGIELTAIPDDISGTYDNGDKVGGIVANVNGEGSTIKNNTVNNFTIRAYRDMGGIVGGNYANVDGNKATNGTITIDQKTNHYGDKAKNAGDIVGRQMGGTVGTNNTSANVTIVEFVADGISKDPNSLTYYVSNANGLAAFSAKALTGNNGTTEEATIQIMNDIDMNDASFSAIIAQRGDKLTIVGNGHTISNVNVVSGADDNTTGQASMFYAYPGSTLEVSNLTLKDITVTAEANATGYAAAVVGYCEGTVNLENVDVENATVTGVKSSGMLAGHMSGNLTATDCNLSGTVTLADFAEEPNGHYAGKYIGTLAGAATINSCTENVTVSGNLNAVNDGNVYGRMTAAGSLTNN